MYRRWVSSGSDAKCIVGICPSVDLGAASRPSVSKHVPKKSKVRGARMIRTNELHANLRTYSRPPHGKFSQTQVDHASSLFPTTKDSYCTSARRGVCEG